MRFQNMIFIVIHHIKKPNNEQNTEMELCGAFYEYKDAEKYISEHNDPYLLVNENGVGRIYDLHSGDIFYTNEIQDVYTIECVEVKSYGK